MKTRTGIAIVVLIALLSFLAGYGITLIGGKKAEERKVLYYVDPMNPAFRSDKPGIAPCGMPLEPVYAEGSGPASGAGPGEALPPGAIRISPERQQLIGVRTTTVEKAPWTHTVRVLGRVAPDETRIYRINAAVSGWVEEVRPVTTGSQVRKNTLLATTYSLEYRTLFQNYMSLTTPEASGGPGGTPEPQASSLTDAQLRQKRKTIQTLNRGTLEPQMDYYRRNLENYGISAHQVEEMKRTRRIPDIAEIRSPINGFILVRNISPGLRFDRGLEFFKIADLSRVWILADVFENEASFFKPGLPVKIGLPYLKKTLHARVSPVLPLFDPATRTLKVRLEADNPGFVMRPDMFVDVELDAGGPPAITVPLDAVLDSGLKKTVFVDRGNGVFEQRQVDTGRSLGDRVEIARGLMPGERIVVSGNFLIDSEARMQHAAQGISGKVGRDLVCRMNIDEDRARAEGHTREYKGETYFFCSPECRDDFAKDPERYLKAAPTGKPGPRSGEPAGGHDGHADGPAPKAAKAAAKRDPHGGMAMPAAGGAKAGGPAREDMPMPMPGGPAPGSPGAGPAVAPQPGAPRGEGFMTLPAQPGAPSLPAQAPGAPPTSMPAAPRMALPPGAAPAPGGPPAPPAPAAGEGAHD
jgi:RND family efflux transporter MFP subunit